MVAFRGGVALQKIMISQKFSGFEKLLLVGVIKGVKAWVMTSHEEVSIEFKNSVTIGFTNSG